MSSFTDHTSIKAYGNKWINTKSFRFYHSDSQTGIYDEVEAGFEFDGCSIPFCVFGQKVEPDTITSCCYHDWLFRYKKYGFFKSNYLFLVAMRVDEVNTFKRARYWIGVTLFGWITYYLKK